MEDEVLLQLTHLTKCFTITFARFQLPATSDHCFNSSMKYEQHLTSETFEAQAGVSHGLMLNVTTIKLDETEKSIKPDYCIIVF